MSLATLADPNHAHSEMFFTSNSHLTPTTSCPLTHCCCLKHVHSLLTSVLIVLYTLVPYSRPYICLNIMHSATCFPFRCSAGTYIDLPPVYPFVVSPVGSFIKHCTRPIILHCAVLGGKKKFYSQSHQK